MNVFERSLGQRARWPRGRCSTATRSTSGLCYGNEALREKLVARDAGLRDLPIEALKAELLGRHAGPARGRA